MARPATLVDNSHLGHRICLHRRRRKGTLARAAHSRKSVSQGWFKPQQRLPSWCTQFQPVAGGIRCSREPTRFCFDDSCPRPKCHSTVSKSVARGHKESRTILNGASARPRLQKPWPNCRLLPRDRRAGPVSGSVGCRTGHPLVRPPAAWSRCVGVVAARGGSAARGRVAAAAVAHP